MVIFNNQKMDPLKKILIGTGIAAVAGIAGYLVYRGVKSEGEGEEGEDKKGEVEALSFDPIDIMEEVLVDSMDYILKIQIMREEYEGDAKKAAETAVNEGIRLF